METAASFASGGTRSVANAGECPLTTEEIVTLVITLIKRFNAIVQRGKLHLYGYQEAFMAAIIWSVLEKDGETTTALWSRQSGKSASLAGMTPVLCLVLPALGRMFPKDKRVGNFAGGFWVGIFAPKADKTLMIFDPLRQKCEDPRVKEEFYADPSFGVDPEGPSVSRGDQVSWSNGSRVVTRSASEQTNNEGDTFHLVIVDEAQLIPGPKVRKEMQPMLKSTNGSMVMIGTANIYRGSAFFDAITYNINAEKKGGKRSHYEFPWDKVCVQKQVAYEETGDEFHTYYEKSVRKELERDYKGNEDAAEFRLNYRLLWQTANLGAIDRVTLVNAQRPDREANEPHLHWRQVAGLDFARKRDVTVLTIGEIDPTPVYETLYTPVSPDEERKSYHRKHILAWHEIRGRKWETILNEAASILLSYRVDTLVADATGVGDPLAEFLQRKAPYLTVVPFLFSPKGNDFLFKLYITEFEAGRLFIPAGPETQESVEFGEFMRQHELLQRVAYEGSNMIKCCAPEGDHDDYADSGALFNYAATLAPSNEVESGLNPAYASSRLTFEGESYGGGREARYRNRSARRR